MLAAGPKALVQAAIGVQADQAEIAAVDTVVAVPGQHDLAVGLQDDAQALISAAAHGHQQLAAARGHGKRRRAIGRRLHRGKGVMADGARMTVIDRDLQMALADGIGSECGIGQCGADLRGRAGQLYSRRVVVAIGQPPHDAAHAPQAIEHFQGHGQLGFTGMGDHDIGQRRRPAHMHKLRYCGNTAQHRRAQDPVDGDLASVHQRVAIAEVR